ncbi:MAG: 30S ribosome-binding factor RbfA [Candidatus Zixiibacteriota bacterium]
MKSYKRSVRVADQIQRDVSEIIADMLRDRAHLMVTISGVEVSDDLRNAKILYTVLGGEEARTEADEFFEATLKEIQWELGKRLRIRKIPELTARYDDSLLEGLRITALIDQVMADSPDEPEDDKENDEAGE